MHHCKRLQPNDSQCSVFTIDYSVNSLPFCRTNVGIFMFLCRCEQSGDFSPPVAGSITVPRATFSVHYKSHDE